MIFRINERKKVFSQFSSQYQKKFAGMKQLHTPLFHYGDDEMLPHYVIVGFVKQPKKLI